MLVIMFGQLKQTLFSALSCCLPLQTIRINNRTFKIIRLLGEGYPCAAYVIQLCRGFSLVYLVQDIVTGRLYALKRIYCQDGNESVAEALKEAELYRMFDHPNIIKALVCLLDCKLQVLQGIGRLCVPRKGWRKDRLYFSSLLQGNYRKVIIITG